ncbi:hypothetical protein F2P81_017028 [Scophthalmus maximus]|uniref:Uncharacterized protein n=1 Tax=Scophthalmus maximus TaxID=52904 RepID=A0A6A4SAR6_SCOMX|nr:hypothetical protein F2P81_017028 [Scophthalmus maximus]
MSSLNTRQTPGNVPHFLKWEWRDDDDVIVQIMNGGLSEASRLPELVGVDFIGKLEPTDGGYQYICVIKEVMCRCSGTFPTSVALSEEPSLYERSLGTRARRSGDPDSGSERLDFEGWWAAPVAQGLQDDEHVIPNVPTLTLARQNG